MVVYVCIILTETSSVRYLHSTVAIFFIINIVTLFLEKF